MELHSASGDHSFHREKQPLTKIAYLLTIPCAIVPIIIAAAGLMYAFREPLFFAYDFLLFIAVYLVYAYGLFRSWKTHRKLGPGLVFLTHLAALGSFSFAGEPEWLGYFVVVSIMATSIVNQYFRYGSLDCADCSSASCEA